MVNISMAGSTRSEVKALLALQHEVQWKPRAESERIEELTAHLREQRRVEAAAIKKEHIPRIREALQREQPKGLEVLTLVFRACSKKEGGTSDGWWYTNRKRIYQVCAEAGIEKVEAERVTGFLIDAGLLGTTRFATEGHVERLLVDEHVCLTGEGHAIVESAVKPEELSTLRVPGFGARLLMHLRKTGDRRLRASSSA